LSLKSKSEITNVGFCIDIPLFALAFKISNYTYATHTLQSALHMKTWAVY